MARFPFPPISPLPVSYSISRTVVFSRTWMKWAVTAAALLLLALLIPLNYALQGYEVASAYKLDSNTTNSHWYNDFSPRPTPGSQCDPRTLTVGDPFITNVGSLQWTMAAGLNPVQEGSQSSPAGSVTAVYHGQSLDFCDIQWMQISADSQSQRVEASAMMMCYNTDPFLLATTTIIAGFPNHDTFQVLAQGFDRKVTWVIKYIQYAGNDLLTQMRRLTNGSESAPSLLSVSAYPTQCPRVMITGDTYVVEAIQTNPSWNNTSWCSPNDTAGVPELDIEWEDAVAWPNVNSNFQALMKNSFNNVFQTLLAAGRMDVGNVLPNNLFYRTESIVDTTDTLLPPFPGGSSNSTADWKLVKELHNPEAWGNYPIQNIPEHPQITLFYLCHLTAVKSAGSAVVSVLVATLSIGSTLWALFVFISSKVYRWKRRDADFCEYHAAISQLQPDIETASVNKDNLLPLTFRPPPVNIALESCGTPRHGLSAASRLSDEPDMREASKA